MKDGDPTLGGGVISSGNSQPANFAASPTPNSTPPTTSTPAPSPTPTAPAPSANPIPLAAPTQPTAPPAPSSPTTPASPATPSYEQTFIQSLKTPTPGTSSGSKDTGDIILNSDPPKKKKTIFIIFTIIVVVSILALVAVFAFTTSQNPSSPQKTADLSKLQTSFNAYANKIFYDSDSTDPISEIPQYNTSAYYLYRYSDDSDQYEEYFNQVSQLYDAFYSDFQSANISNEALSNLVAENKNLIDFLKIDPSSQEFSYKNIMRVYVNEGEKTAKSESQRILSSISGENQYIQIFRDYKTDEFNTVIQEMGIINDQGCIINHSIDEQCVENITTQISADDAGVDTDDRDENTLASFLNDCYDGIYIYYNDTQSLLEGQNT